MSGEYTLSVSQKDFKMFPRKSNYDYSNCKIIIAKLNGDFLKEIQKEWTRDTHIEFDCLDSGEYKMYIELSWLENTEK